MKKVLSPSLLEQELTPEQLAEFKKKLKTEGVDEALTSLPDLGDIVQSASPANYRIKALRTENGLTQTDLANILDVSQKEYWRYEQEGYSINIVKLGLIAFFYNVSLDWIAGICNEKKPIFKDQQTSVNGYVLKDMKVAKANGAKYIPNSK